MSGRFIRSLAGLLPLLSPSGCAGTLAVTRLEEVATDDGAGIPFYLPQQEITVIESGLDRDGQPARLRPLHVALVTRRDPERAFLVRNVPGFCAESEFAVTRSADGVLRAISTRSDEKSRETVEALASVVLQSAVLAKGRAERERLETELAVQREAAARLIEELSRAPADKVRLLQLALASTHVRAEALEAELRSQGVGVSPSRRRRVTVEVLGSENKARARSRAIPPGRIECYLVPVDSGDLPCPVSF